MYKPCECDEYGKALTSKKPFQSTAIKTEEEDVSIKEEPFDLPSHEDRGGRYAHQGRTIRST